jgi:RNA polymerase sigma-32 factor
VREHRVEWQRLRRLGESAPILSLEQERELIAAALTGNALASKRIVQSHLRLVLKIAARYERRGLLLEDLVSEGTVGLLEALQRFEPTRCVRFAGYAAWWIRARISQYALANRRVVALPSTRNARFVLRDLQRAEHILSQRLLRAPSHDELAQEIGVPVAELGQVRAALQAPDLSLDHPIAADQAESPEQLALEHELQLQRQEQIRIALQGLSSREQAVVHEQYLAEDGRSLSQLGAAFGVSRQRLGQVLCGARAKLKCELVHVA